MDKSVKSVHIAVNVDKAVFPLLSTLSTLCVSMWTRNVDSKKPTVLSKTAFVHFVHFFFYGKEQNKGRIERIVIL